MSVMKSANVYAFDREAGATLKAVGSSAVTGAGANAEAALALNTLSGAYWDNSEIPFQGFSAILEVTAVDNGDGDETYVYTIEADTAAGFASAVTVATVTLDRDSAVGSYKVLLDGDTLSSLEPGATHLRAVMTNGGTTPSITYHSWLYGPVH